MTEGIWVALIGLLGSGLGSLAGVLASQKLTQYRIQELEKKVQAHNNLVTRTYQLEQEQAVLQEKVDVANHRISDLEQLYRDLSGPEKLEKAKEGIVEMLNEKGIPISEMEMDLLIESVVQEFNQGVKGEHKTEESPEAQAESEDVHESAGL